MRDRIIAAYLKDFIEEFGLSDLNEAEAFEHFVNCFCDSRYLRLVAPLVAEQPVDFQGYGSP